MRDVGGVEVASGVVRTVTIIGFHGGILFKSFPRVCMGKDKTWKSVLAAMIVNLDVFSVWESIVLSILFRRRLIISILLLVWVNMMNTQTDNVYFRHSPP